jgi:hypothetical protein
VNNIANMRSADGHVSQRGIDSSPFNDSALPFGVQLRMGTCHFPTISQRHETRRLLIINT